MTDLALLLHIVLAIAALVTPIVIGVRVLEGPDPDLFSWNASR